MRKMTREELESEVRVGVSRRLRVDPSIVSVIAFESGMDGMVGIDVRINGAEGTEDQKASITQYLRDTVDPGAFEAPSC